MCQQCFVLLSSVYVMNFEVSEDRFLLLFRVYVMKFEVCQLLSVMKFEVCYCYYPVFM